MLINISVNWKTLKVLFSFGEDNLEQNYRKPTEERISHLLEFISSGAR